MSIGKTLGSLTLLDSLPDAARIPIIDPTEDPENQLKEILGLTIKENAYVSYYGIAINKTTHAIRRIGAHVNLAAGAKLPDALLPIQSKMRRCVMAADGSIEYYTGAYDSTVKEETNTASVLTGADGQVMVEVPKGYIKVTETATEYEILISEEPFSGAVTMSAFVGSAEKDHVYFGAYEGGLFDASAAEGVGAYVDGDGDTDNTADIDFENDHIGSVSGIKPYTGLTLSEMHTLCTNLGSGWTLETFPMMFLRIILFMIEYGSLNSQDALGAGNTDFAAWSYADDVADTGLSNSLGNQSGNTTTMGGSKTTDFMSYRGIENMWGNVWKWIHGIMFYKATAGAATQDIYYKADNTDIDADLDITTESGLADRLIAAGWTKLTGVDATAADGYITAMKFLNAIFYPTAASGGSSVTGFTDYQWRNSGWRVLLSGGFAGNGSRAGVFAWYAYYAASYSYSIIGGRLCKI
jgi:hypothetical protein